MISVDASPTDHRTTRLHVTGGSFTTIAFLVATLAWCLPLFYFERWTPWYVLLVAATPLGLTALAGLVSARDGAAILATLLVVWSIVSALQSSSPWLSLRGASGRDYSVVTLVGALSMWAIGRRLSEPSRRLIGPTTAVLLTLGSVVGTLQVFDLITSGLLASFPGRAAGFATNPAYFGSLMAALTGFAAVRSVGPTNTARWLTAVALGGYGVVISGSRVAAVSSVIMVATAMMLAWRDGATTRRVAATVGALLVGWAIAVPVTRLADARGAVDRLEAGTAGRFQVWRYAQEALPDRPVFGTGLGLFRDAVQSRFTSEFVRNHTNGGSQPWGDPHNIAVLLVVSTGVLGLGLAAGFAVLASRRTDRSLLLLFLGIALTWTLQPTPIVVAPFAMLVLGAASNDRLPAIASAARPMYRSVPMYLGLLLGAYIAVSDAALYRAEASPTASGIDVARTLFVGDVRVEGIAAELFVAVEDQVPGATERALDAARSATELEPTRPMRWVERARVEMFAGRMAEARASLERALELEPTSRDGWFELSRWARIAGDEALQRDALDRACALTGGCELETSTE